MKIMFNFSNDLALLWLRTLTSSSQNVEQF